MKPRAKRLGRLFLALLSFLWTVAHRLRRLLYHSGALSRNTFHVPIISVGNLTFGGTGKTPFTLWLSNHFAEQSKRTMILTRGYKGDLEHGSGVLRSGQLLGNRPVNYGDEALLLARRSKRASVVVGKDRASNLERHFHKEEPDVVILDDGHQHLQLARNLNIVLFDMLTPLASYRVAPLGYMREDFSALQDADIVILNKTDQVEPAKINALKAMLAPHMRSGTPVAETRYKPTAVVGVATRARTPCREMAGKRVVCVAGIASPKSFFLMVRDLGCEIVETFPFPDHHHFSKEEFAPVIELAAKRNAVVLITEKDMVSLRRFAGDADIRYLEVEMDFLKGRKAVAALVDEALARPPM